jgi:hypothetical protein
MKHQHDQMVLERKIQQNSTTIQTQTLAARANSYFYI